MLVKNEEDIIASTLRAAAEWSDKLIVLDNGSTDRTWEIVNDMASLHPCIIPFAQDGRPFRIGLRALMFDAFKHEMTDEDWWCIRMDADEFYVESPREFLQNIPKRFKQVSKAVSISILQRKMWTNLNSAATLKLTKIKSVSQPADMGRSAFSTPQQKTQMEYRSV
jgi:hypothetical protein